ncbi:nuclear transport factor 2 family protein [Aliikangiella coralliicola]|uniref:Nuclear transport factor 2 family protein n=1 Tax=Aliikangiella coralliicola TaxID=2592383 RepID=A0A545UH94_9GAMM|nr:nuclear transport factor 2 family protein [Aliikangiella coralliicola]TQV88841.1 nuclear transport factor 2 family protein [Aliikangiella coralliicola]
MQNEITYIDDTQVITSILKDYFDGLYEADVKKLRAIFHSDVYLKAPNLRRSLTEWLDLVASRPVPKQEKELYRFNILSIEVIGEQAMAKVECPILDNFYIDFLGFLKENGEWKIVNKMYCSV